MQHAFSTYHNIHYEFRIKAQGKSLHLISSPFAHLSAEFFHFFRRPLNRCEMQEQEMWDWRKSDSPLAFLIAKLVVCLLFPCRSRRKTTFECLFNVIEIDWLIEGKNSSSCHVLLLILSLTFTGNLKNYINSNKLNTFICWLAPAMPKRKRNSSSSQKLKRHTKTMAHLPKLLTALNIQFNRTSLNRNVFKVVIHFIVLFSLLKARQNFGNYIWFEFQSNLLTHPHLRFALSNRAGFPFETFHYNKSVFRKSILEIVFLLIYQGLARIGKKVMFHVCRWFKSSSSHTNKWIK